MGLIIEIRKLIMSVGILDKLMAYAHYIVYICLVISLLTTFVPMPAGISILCLIFFWVAVVLLLGKGDLKTIAIAFGVSGGIFLISLISVGAKYSYFSGGTFFYMVVAIVIAVLVYKQMGKYPYGQIVFPDEASNTQGNMSSGQTTNSSGVRFCPKCGNEFDDVNQPLRFCPKCGNELNLAQNQQVKNAYKYDQAQSPPAYTSRPSANTQQPTGQQPSVNGAVKEAPISREYLQSLKADAEKKHSAGIKSLIGGIVFLVIWMICFFSPIRINYVFFPIIGGIMIVIGIVQMVSASSELEELNRKSR